MVSDCAKVTRGVTVLMAAALLLFAGFARPALATTWDAYTYLPVSTQPAVEGLNALFARIKTETKGDLDITLHLGGALPINATNITAAVADNVVQLGTDGFFSGSLPIAGILRMPMLIRDYDEFAKAEAIMMPYIEAAYAKKGILVLGEFVYPMQVIWSRKKLTSLADIKGQKLRVTAVEQGEFVRRFGGIAVTMGTPDVPAALDRGVVDGALTATTGAGLTWKDLLKYSYRFPVQYANALIIVNKRAFEALPAAEQTMLREGFRRANPEMTATMRTEEDTITAKLAKEGLVVTQTQPGDMDEATKRMTPYWDTWARAHGPDAVEAMAKVRAALGR
jgi:TRAP-type C4-dicarboxylate transport system substrate-binding protein